MKDLKEALGNARKPDITHVRKAILDYIARACEYGDDKYERANYLRSTTGGTAADFVRFRAYLRAAVSHIVDVLDSMESHQANDPRLEDVTGMIAACSCADTDQSGRFPASELPHVALASASLMMAICQAIPTGLLPRDPGKPWATNDHESYVTIDDEPVIAEPLPGEAPVCRDCGSRIYGDDCAVCRAAKTVIDAQAGTAQ